MSRPRLFICNGLNVPLNDPLREGRYPVVLRTRGEKANVHLRLEDVANVFHQHLSARLEDLLEIAAFVYAADSATARAGIWTAEESHEPWERISSSLFQSVTCRSGTNPT